MKAYLKPLLGLFIIALVGCKKDPTPTKQLMQGNWELTSATDDGGNDITSQVAFPVTVIQLTDDNGMIGTQGPMFTRIVYGDSKWIQASAKIKQIFDYANLRLNTGEFFVGEGVQNTFTVEAKLQATAAVGGLKDVLEILGVANGYLQQTIYHKFLNVSVSFPGYSEEDGAFSNNKNESADIMVWEFTTATEGAYNYKDAQGNQLMWNGWPVNSFKRCKFTFTKRTQGINDIIKAKI